MNTEGLCQCPACAPTPKPLQEATGRTDTMLARLVDALEDELHERRLAWLRFGEHRPESEARWAAIVRISEVLATLRKGVR